jgi:threonine/homoserine/homoserine lactone efflux protein
VWENLVLGVSLGLGAGLAPGPMTAVVVATALESGPRAGAQAAFAPLITDGPILLLALWALGFVPRVAYSVLGLLGGGYLVFLGLRTLRERTHTPEGREAGGRLGWLRRAVVANFLNPSPYLFWGTVGSPIVREAWVHSPLSAAAFLVPFFGLLVGSKVAVAWAVAAGSRRLTEAGHRKLAAAGGGLLVLAGVLVAVRSALV